MIHNECTQKPGTSDNNDYMYHVVLLLHNLKAGIQYYNLLVTILDQPHFRGIWCQYHTRQGPWLIADDLVRVWYNFSLQWTKEGNMKRCRVGISYPWYSLVVTFISRQIGLRNSNCTLYSYKKLKSSSVRTYLLPLALINNYKLDHNFHGSRRHRTWYYGENCLTSIISIRESIPYRNQTPFTVVVRHVRMTFLEELPGYQTRNYLFSKNKQLRN